MRDGKGKFVKGSPSGNPNGRPKSFKITEEDRNNFGDDPFKALVFLMKKSETRDELFRYVKELLPYTKPRLSSMKQEVSEVREIRISWGGSSAPFGSLEVEQTKMIEVEDESKRLELTKDDLSDIMKDLSTKKPRGRPKKVK